MTCPGCTVGTDFLKSKGITPVTMSKANVEESLTFLYSQAQLRGDNLVKVKYAGGEPTMAFDNILTAQPILATLSDKTGIGYTQRLLTNGSNLLEYAPQLSKMPNMQVAVSLWGLGENNSKFRGLKLRGQQADDNFNHIVDGIRSYVCNNNGSLNIQHTIGPFNAEYFPDMVRAVWDPSSNNFIGNDWKKDPWTLSVSIWRPPGRVLNARESKKIWEGLERGLESVQELQGRGIEIPHLSTCFDYLSLQAPKLRVCGSGVSYASLSTNQAGDSVVTRCHAINPSIDQGVGIPLRTITPDFMFQDLSEIPQTAATLDKILSNPSGSIPSTMWAGIYGGAGCPDQRSLAHREVVLQDILGLPPEHPAHLEASESSVPLPATLYIYQPLFYSLLTLIADSDQRESVKNTFKFIFWDNVNAHSETNLDTDFDTFWNSWKNPSAANAGVIANWASNLNLKPTLNHATGELISDSWKVLRSSIDKKTIHANTISEKS